MLSDQRRARIIQMAESEGFVTLQQLVAELNTSESTVRRDLEYLDSTGRLHRTRGGAAMAAESREGADFDARMVQASIEKRRIARRAAELIPDGETVLLDGGTTTLEVARCLTGRSLQVVTNSLPIATLLMNQTRIEVILIGGFVYPKTGVALGEQAVAAIKNINVSRLVMGAGGVTEQGLFNSNALLVETERQMIQAAERVTLVADSGKFDQRALTHLCPLEAVHEVVTDSAVPVKWEHIFESSGIAMEVVPAGETAAAEKNEALRTDKSTVRI